MTPERGDVLTPVGMAPVVALDGADAAAYSARPDSHWIAFAIIAVVVVLSIWLVLNPAWIARFGSWGYAGAFLINLLASASLFLPIPGLPIAIAMSVALNPLLLAVVASAGSAFGELAGYAVGYSGRTMTHSEKVSRYAPRIEAWTRHYGAYAIFVIAVLPLPFDFAGVAAGASRMQIWRFFLATLLGKFTKYYVIILIASGSMVGLRHLFGW